MSTIQLRTEIPGPNSRALADRREAAVARGLSHATPLYVARAQDAWLEDVDGNRFLDFAGGIGCINTGHRNQAVISAIEAQLQNFLHTCSQVTPYESYIKLAERLNQLTPGKFPKKTILLNSGAEAVENAIKIARAHTGRSAVIAFEDAFHGRTGKMFASEHYGIEPDMIVTAKSLGGGLPLAAVTGRADIMDAPGPGGLGGTFAGSPLACVAANAVLDVLEGSDLLQRAEMIGKRFVARAKQWQERFDLIGDLRGLGGMRAIELVNSRETRAPATEQTKEITQYCYEHGLITITAGTYGNVIRVLVPLVISDAQMDEALDVLESAIASVGSKPARAGEMAKK